MLFTGNTPSFNEVIPARVTAAFRFIEFCETIREEHQTDLDHPVRPGRELNKAEQATYDAALRVLQQYFNGEMDYAPGPFANPPPPVEQDCEPPSTIGCKIYPVP